MTQSAQQMFDLHREILDRAVAATSGRDFWTPYPESMRKYPEDAVKAAPSNNPAANASLCNQAFVANRFVVVQSRRHGQSN
ncbi:hypothetical protein QT231_21225 [Halomonas sp. SpR1]|uniref:hypothetical protein n=1 Tax=Halomonas sp. SpR1 TaxID=3050462 RepID=UPI0027E4CAB4|nr:hypothetical protein [Halomonas sp. SpR1]MDQ7735229.1 hypothetical protein [Halomonas sp. SpR1]